MAAPRKRLRVEPYESNPVDADNDGIVQEGTAFERPAGTNIVDELGNIIQAGVVATERGNFRVVDADGNTVDYTPTYTAAGAVGEVKKPGQQSALGQTIGQRMGTLGERSQTLGSRYRTIGQISRGETADVPSTRAAQEAAAAAVPGVTVRDADVPDAPEPPRRGTPEAIRARNAEVISQIEAAGGFFDFSSLPHEERDAFIEREKMKTVTSTMGANPNGGRESVRKRWTFLVDAEKERVTYIEDLINKATNPEDKERFRQRAAVAKQVVEYLEARDSDQVIDDIVSLVRQITDDDDTRVAVQIPVEKFPEFLSQGYKTTHEAHSDHSAPDIRTGYEVTQGIPADAPASVRPASGYLQIGARRRAARQLAIDEGAVDPDADSTVAKHNAGPAGLYGKVQMIMKPDASGRTRFGMGDSFNSSMRSAPLVGATDDQLVDAVLATDGGKGAFLDSEKKRFSDLVEVLATGGNAELLGALPTDDRVVEKSGMPEQRGSLEYWETLIFGSFDISDIAEISIPESEIPRTVKPKGNFGKDTRDWLAQSLRDNPELFQFLSMEQIQELRRLIELHPDKAERMMGKLTNVLNFIDELKDQQNFLQRIAAVSPDTKVTITTPGGKSNLAPSRFGLPEDGDVMAFLEGRIEVQVNSIFEQLQQLPTGPAAEVAEVVDDDDAM